MKLLKTVLLSTTLMMSTAFGSEAITADEALLSDRSDAQVFTDTLSEIRAENAQYLAMIKKLVSKVHAGEVVATARGEFVDLIHVLARGLNATIKGKKQLESDLETAKGQLTTATTANETLTAEKAAAELALATATEQLAAVTAEKEIVDEKLTAAEGKLAELTVALAVAKTAKDEAESKAAEWIEGLKIQLHVAKTQVEDLTTKANDLTDLNHALQVSIKATKADQRRIADELAAAARGRRQAALAVDLDE